MCLQAILDAPALPNQWYLSYGLTEARRDALTDGSRHSDSFLNPNSETALTLFTLGRLDCWVQCGGLLTNPRTENGWNTQLFDNLRANETNLAPGHQPFMTPLRQFLAGVLGVQADDLGDAILMFEFEARNNAFHGGTALETLSFLDIAQKWSAFDALLMLPRIKRFIFVESKLGADIGRKTAHYPLINQATRNLESAFFLCRHPDSLYCQGEWDFTYLLICPQREFDYRATYYSCVFQDLHNHLRLHGDILRNEYTGQANQQRINDLFARFQTEVPDRIMVTHWSVLWNLLHQHGFDFDAYEENLTAHCGADADLAIHAARNRLRIAGVDV
jgi:hypothetical protein